MVDVDGEAEELSIERARFDRVVEVNTYTKGKHWNNATRDRRSLVRLLQGCQW